MNKSSNQSPHSIYLYLSVIVFLLLSGIGTSIYLFQSHYKVYTDISYASFCALSKAINCDTVSQSSYSIFCGLPVSVWGLVGYIFMLAVVWLSFDTQNRILHQYPILITIGSIFSVFSIILGVISAKIIKAYCLMCIATYGINFLLLFMVWLVRRRFEKSSWKNSILQNIQYIKDKKIHISVLLFVTALTILSIKTFIPKYWSFDADAIERGLCRTGITEDGSPWIGADHPNLTIVEYTDYMCFQCKKMHFYLRGMLNKYPDDLRLVHKHFPMDQQINPSLIESLHPGSAVLSLLAIYATLQDKFWDVNDYLYNHNVKKRGAIYLREIAETTGLDLNLLKQGLSSKKVRTSLDRDIISGLKHNITSTPTYIIDGQVYTGQIPPQIFDVLKK